MGRPAYDSGSALGLEMRVLDVPRDASIACNAVTFSLSPPRTTRLRVRLTFPDHATDICKANLLGREAREPTSGRAGGMQEKVRTPL
jgi:hypothetical protein